MDNLAIIKLFEGNTFYFLQDKDAPEVQKPVVINETPSVSATLPVEDTSEQNGVLLPEKVEVQGSGKSGVVVVVHYSGDMPANDRELLTKILAAVNVDIHEVLLSNIHDFSGLEIDLKNVNLIFGQRCHDHLLPDAPFYEVFKEEGSIFLFSDELPLLHDNRDAKMKLWQALKSVF